MWQPCVLQEAYESVKQTQRLFNRKFGINLAPTRRTIYAIHHKFMKTESCTLRQKSQILHISVVS